MQYAVAILLSFAGAALAQVAGFDAITSPPEGSTLKAGETFQIVWDAAPAEFDSELIDIVLLAGGSPSTLSVVDPPIAKGLKNSVGKFDWDVSAELGQEKTYGLKIVLEKDPKTFQFSFPFAITPSEGGSTGNSSTTSKAQSSSTTSAVDEEETGSSAVRPKTTLYTTADDSTAAAATPTPTSKVSPGAGPQVTAGAFAIFGGLAIAAIGL